MGQGEKIVWFSWRLKPVIERAALDGSRREVIVQGVGRSTGLTIDTDKSPPFTTP